MACVGTLAPPGAAESIMADFFLSPLLHRADQVSEFIWIGLRQCCERKDNWCMVLEATMYGIIN